ncbi:hypothetical protein [Oceanithermus sp.]
MMTLRRAGMALLLLVAAAACTGTEEPPLELLLAVGAGDAVVFYPAGTDAADEVGRWSLGAPVVDLARAEGEVRLWVLAPDALRAYPLQGSRSDRGPDPVAASVELPLGVDCSEGTLELGATHLLVQCGADAWTVPLDDPALEPVDTGADPEGTLYLLGPDDRVVRVEPTVSGFHLVYPQPPDDPLEYDAGVPAGVAALAAAWSADRLAVALGSGPPADAAFYLWTAGSTEPPRAEAALGGLSEPRWLQPLQDGWLVGGVEFYLLRREGKDDVVRSGGYLDAAVTPDAYAYLIAPGRLVVIDLLDPNLSEHVRAVGAQAAAIAFFPASE